SRPYAGLSGTYSLDAQGGNDQLVIDYAVSGLESKDISFAGNTGSDTLWVKGGTLGNITYNYTNGTDGNIKNYSDAAGTTLLSTVTYTGLAPIINTGL